MANKWIPLDGKKDPPFDKKMIILIGISTWMEVNLKNIQITEKGKEYVFIKFGDSDMEYTTATHYMIPEPPKNNQ